MLSTGLPEGAPGTFFKVNLLVTLVMIPLINQSGVTLNVKSKLITGNLDL